MAGLLDQPPPPPKRVSGNAKTLILWVVLVAMFVGLYQLFSAPNAQPPRAPSAPTDWMPSVMGGFAVLVVFIFFFIRRRAVNAFNAANNEAIGWLNKGMATRAAERFTQLAQKYRWPRNLRATARFNMAHALLRAGQPAKTIEGLTALIKLKEVAGFKPTIAIELAVAHTLVGQVAEASRWLASAEQAPGVSVYNLVWPRALLAARRGELAEMTRSLEASWRELEVHLSGEVLRRLTLLRAFAVATVEGPRGESMAEPLLLRLRPVASDEFTWVTVQWPELGAFIVSHQLR